MPQKGRDAVLAPYGECRVLIGVAGLNCAGKGEFISVLKQLGYKGYSLSDMIREELGHRRMEPSRENLIQVGNQMREGRGSHILAHLVLERIKEERTVRAAVDSIRNNAELELLRTHEGFSLVVVTAPVQVRFQRAVSRGRGEDYKDLEAFIETERREFSRGPSAQQLDEVIRQGDYRLRNDDSLEAFRTKARELAMAIEQRTLRS